jgi:hypothetical protein
MMNLPVNISPPIRTTSYFLLVAAGKHDCLRLMKSKRSSYLCPHYENTYGNGVIAPLDLHLDARWR